MCSVQQVMVYSGSLAQVCASEKAPRMLLAWPAEEIAPLEMHTTAPDV